MHWRYVREVCGSLQIHPTNSSARPDQTTKIAHPGRGCRPNKVTAALTERRLPTDRSCRRGFFPLPKVLFERSVLTHLNHPWVSHWFRIFLAARHPAQSRIVLRSALRRLRLL